MAIKSLGEMTPNNDIVWRNSGIPSSSDVVDGMGDLLDGKSNAFGQEAGSNCFITPPFETGLGEGPKGNMFGESSPDASEAIQKSYVFAGPDAVAALKEGFQPIERVEGFGEFKNDGQAIGKSVVGKDI